MSTRVLHVITGLATGGAERALYNLLYGGLAAAFDCHVISLGDEGAIGPQIRALGVPLTTLDMPGGRPTLSGLSKLRRTAREFGPDIIHGWMYHGNLAASVARMAVKGRPALAWGIRQSLYDLAHEKPMTRQVIRANKMLSSGPDELLYNSQLSRTQHEEFGFETDNGQVISNGIDVHQFSSCSKMRERVRAELGIPEECHVVGHVARLHPMKDHPNFLRAAVAVIVRHPDVHFVLVGKDVTLENELLGDFVAPNDRHRFHFLGERSDVSDLMNAMDIFCQSSWAEAFPNVLGEAMAMGLPCVATDVGDSARIVGDTGCLVAARDKDALAAGIGELLDMPNSKRRELGASANARIEDNYTLHVFVQKYAGLYESMAKTTQAA